MFKAVFVNSDGWNKVKLTDELSNTAAEIIPGWGASLHVFSVKTATGMPLNLVEHYTGGDDIAENLTAKGFRGSKLSPFVCRLKNSNYNFDGKQYTITKFRLGNHALHGLLYDQPFEVLDIGEAEEKAWVTMQHAYRGEQAGFPFHYDCKVTYILSKDNHLAIHTEVMNRSGAAMPIQDGWHPYFSLGAKIDDLQLQFKPAGILEFDAALIPTGKLLQYDAFNDLKPIGTTVFDNCFLLHGEDSQPVCILRSEALQLQLEIFGMPYYPYLQLYTPPGRNSIAIENLSGAPDAFNNGIGAIIIEDNETCCFDTVYAVKVNGGFNWINL